ncbi:YxcD family protein [Paenibacillus sp. P25]|nr:YxcD family protein [Paenibacillus sp. P25]
MKIQFDEQDLIDSVCVAIAARVNRGQVEGDEPHHVNDIKLFFDEHKGFSARGRLHYQEYFLNQQELIDAVALYLSAYYSFNAARLLINLSWDEITKHFNGEITVER